MATPTQYISISVPEFVLDSHPATQLAKHAPWMFNIIFNEIQRQQELILIASECYQPEAVLAASGSVLANKYAEGYPKRRYYSGCENIDVSETAAIENAKILWGGKYANVQPHSGADANNEVYAALSKRRSVILSMSLNHGGHLSHGAEVNQVSKDYRVIQYGVNAQGFIDFNQVRELAHKYKPAIIVAGGSSYPRAIDYIKFREIADEVGARLVSDMAHPAGLIAAGLLPSPIDIADATTSTSQKTPLGPRGGLILSGVHYEDIVRYVKKKGDKKKTPVTLATAIDQSVFPGRQGGPLEHTIAAKAVAFRLALNKEGTSVGPEYVEHQRRVIENAKLMAQGFQELEYRVLTGGTDMHMVLIELPQDISGLAVQRALEQVGISLNRNAIPDDPKGPYLASGLRIGSPMITQRGLSEEAVREIPGLIDRVIRGTKETQKGKPELEETVRVSVSKRVKEITDSAPFYWNLVQTMAWIKARNGI